MRKNEEKWGKMRKNEEKWGKMRENEEKWWKMMKTEEKWWKMPRSLVRLGVIFLFFFFSKSSLKLCGFDQVSEMPKWKKSDCFSARLSAFENSGLIALKQVLFWIPKRAMNALKWVDFRRENNNFLLEIVTRLHCWKWEETADFG